MKGIYKMDDLLRAGYSMAEVETVNVNAGRFAELIQKKAIYNMFEVSAECSENNYESFKAISDMFPSVCCEGGFMGAKGRVAISEEKYSQLVCTEQNLYELYLLFDSENFYISVGKLLNFFNIKRQARGEAELVPVVKRDENGNVAKHGEATKEESGEVNVKSA